MTRCVLCEKPMSTMEKPMRRKRCCLFFLNGRNILRLMYKEETPFPQILIIFHHQKAIPNNLYPYYRASDQQTSLQTISVLRKYMKMPSNVDGNETSAAQGPYTSLIRLNGKFHFPKYIPIAPGPGLTSRNRVHGSVSRRFSAQWKISGSNPEGYSLALS